MKKELLQQVIVVNCQVNVKIFDKYFFIKHNIITDDEFSSMSQTPIFNEIYVQIINEAFQLTISPLQIVLYSVKNNNKQEINKLLQDILQYAEINKINNFGLNFDWIIKYNSREELQTVSKDYFRGNNLGNFSKLFNTSDAQFGYYVSRDILNARLKLDIKPISELKDPFNDVTSVEALFFQFNFHFKDDTVKLMTVLEQYDSYLNESNKIMETFK